MKEKPTPYTYKIHGDNKEIIIFGLSHTYDEKHPQFAQIKDMISKFDPQVVLFEIPKDAEKLLYSKDSNDAIQKIGEKRIIRNLLDDSVKLIAADNHMSHLEDIDSISTENKFILKLLLKTYSICINNDVDVKEFILGELQRENKMELKNKIFNYIKDFTDEEIDNITRIYKIIPTPIDNFNQLNVDMRILSLKRDEEMIDEIIKAREEFDRVMFFVGRNHALRWEKVLKKLIE